MTNEEKVTIDQLRRDLDEAERTFTETITRVALAVSENMTDALLLVGTRIRASLAEIKIRDAD